MSLVGNLADLSLGDIFQIVSLSRRSGALQLDTSLESGEIVFYHGKVVAAARSRPPHTVGDVLMQSGVVSPQVYQDMLAEQAKGVTGADLFTHFNIDPEGVDRAFESLLTRTIYEMFEWDDGTFSFVLSAEPELWTGFSLSAGRVVLTRGLNPQYLAIEGARIRDEKQRQDPLESFLARARPPRESSSQATAELSSALRGEAAPELEAAEDFSSLRDIEENIIPFPGNRPRPKLEPAPPDVPPPEVPPAARMTPPPAPILTAPGAALPPRPTALVPPVGLVIPPDSIFATRPARASAMKEWHLVVVDDDVLIGRLIASELSHKFSVTHVVSKVNDALELLTKLQGELVVVALDLIVPRSDGRGILGGVEVLEGVRQSSALVPVVMFSDYRNEEAEARARAMGVDAFVAKPRKAHVFADDISRTPSDAMRTFVIKLGEALEAYTRDERPIQAPAPIGYRFAEPPKPPAGVPLEPPELRASAEAQTLRPPEPPSQPFTVSHLDLDASVEALVEEADRHLGARAAPNGELHNLRSMLAELIDPANRDTITLLVLRFASDVVERAGLFLVTRRAFVGLGGFSVNEGSDPFVGRVRRIQIAVDQDSVFAKVVQYRSMVHGPLADTPANRALLEGLGGTWHGNPTIAVPIISSDKVAAILFGDNPSGKPLGATEGLEIFLQQAGLAMDRALLERRLEESRKKRDEGR